MSGNGSGCRRVRLIFCAVVAVACCAALCGKSSYAQSNEYERSFPQSKATVEKALKEMQAASGGRLPVLDGFATAADHPLDRYQRGYYQAKFQVTATPSGGSVVRVSAQVTAWYVDAVAARSGYQLLTSNGRLEADLLDQLADHLAGKALPAGTYAPANAARKPFPSEQRTASGRTTLARTSSEPAAPPEQSKSAAAQAAPTPDAEPTLSAPVPRIPENSGGFSSSLAQSLAGQEAGAQSGQKDLEDKDKDKDQASLRAEAASLEEILKSQAHPKNLVAVKKSGTPVVASASLTAKTLFMASAHDEFEMLDFDRDWVHVRVSGLSRAWIWRNNLEMPDSVPDTDAPSSPVPSAAELFHVTREETAPFPGDWAPLRGKSVRIISVEKINEAKDAGPQLRLEFAKSMLDKDFAELEKKPQELSGIVLIFDSVDGGMIAATYSSLQQWKAGKLSDAALWHQCFFDPPETFSESGVSASQ
jgi:hypothetical protein